MAPRGQEWFQSGIGCQQILCHRSRNDCYLKYKEILIRRQKEMKQNGNFLTMLCRFCRLIFSREVLLQKRETLQWNAMVDELNLQTRNACVLQEYSSETSTFVPDGVLLTTMPMPSYPRTLPFLIGVTRGSVILDFARMCQYNCLSAV